MKQAYASTAGSVGHTDVGSQHQLTNLTNLQQTVPVTNGHQAMEQQQQQQPHQATRQQMAEIGMQQQHQLVASISNQNHHQNSHHHHSNPFNSSTSNHQQQQTAQITNNQNSMNNSSNNFKKELPANGKKTKGRVRIKMEFIHNKLRRYTTFSKRKTGIMKKVSSFRGFSHV